MESTLEQSGQLTLRGFKFNGAEVLAACATALPVGIAGTVVGATIVTNHDDPTLYESLNREQEEQQNLLSSLHAIESDPTLRLINADPVRVDEAKTKIGIKLQSIEAQKPNQYSTGESVGLIIGGELTGVAIAMCGTILAIRTSKRIRQANKMKKDAYAASLHSLAVTLVNATRYSSVN